VDCADGNRRAGDFTDNGVLQKEIFAEGEDGGVRNGLNPEGGRKMSLEIGQEGYWVSMAKAEDAIHQKDYEAANRLLRQAHGLGTLQRRRS
jgi:hypothetical protein